jgi:hypothetical protein
VQIWTTVKSKRQGALENGEIDTSDAYQQEIWCSWPELFDAPAALAEQLNKNLGYLKVATPGMPMSHWAQAVNGLKRQLLIPGQVRQRELHWDGVDIGDLMRKLRVLEAYGTVDMHNLPGYENNHPAVLTCDAAGNCLLDNTVHGRQIAKYTGRIASIDDIKHYEAIARKMLRYQMMTPATIMSSGYELHGLENMPERTEIMRTIPDDGPALLRARCIYCGTAVKVRGEMRDGRPHYEIDTTPVCPHLQLRIKQYPGRNGSLFSRLHVYHYQQPPAYRHNHQDTPCIHADEIHNSVLDANRKRTPPPTDD